jgi:alginate O-acetyltransferase complex protein AlgI
VCYDIRVIFTDIQQVERRGARSTALPSLVSIAALMAIALFAPNSQQWLGYDPQRPVEEQPSWTTRFAAYPIHGAALGCLLVFTLTQMSAVQSFLYFQF